MTRGLVALLALGLAACPASAPSNPHELWLSLNGDELHVQLVPVEPDPF
jgi:hypothetical protein